MPTDLAVATALALLATMPACFTPRAPETSAGLDPGSTSDDGTNSEPSSSDPTTGVPAPTSSDPSDPSDPSDTAGGSTSGGEDPSETGDETGSGEEDDGSESGDAPSCAAGSTCVASVPPGWDGLVSLTQDACPDELPIEVSLSHDGLAADPPSCACDCGEPFDTDCDGAVMRARGPNNCVDEDFTAPPVTFNPGACANVSAFSAGSWTEDHSNFPLSPVGGGACEPIEAFDIPTAAWTSDFRTCAIAEPPQICENGGTCQPDAGGPMCIHREGDHACPPGPFTERTLTFESIDDDRDCSACSCGPPAGMCGGSIIFTSGGCGAGSIFIGSVSVEACGAVSGATHGSYDLQPDADCTAAGGAAQGEATPADPRTICCAG